MSLWCAPAPDQTVWWNSTLVTASVIAELRLQSGDVDEGRITTLVDVAGEMINDYLDRECPMSAPTPSMVNALVALTCELYGRDVPVYVNGARAEQPGGVDPAAVAVIRAAMLPKKQRFGVA